MSVMRGLGAYRLDLGYDGRARTPEALKGGDERGSFSLLSEAAPQPVDREH